MQGNKFPTELPNGLKQVEAGGQWQTWEVYLQEFSIACPVTGAVEDGVHIVKDIRRAKGLCLIALTIGYKFHAEAV